MTTTRITHGGDLRHTREAVRAASLTRQSGAVWNAYAHCDRAPFGWEVPAHGLAAPVLPAAGRYRLTPKQWIAVAVLAWASVIAAWALALAFHRYNTRTGRAA